MDGWMGAREARIEEEEWSSYILLVVVYITHTHTDTHINTRPYRWSMSIYTVVWSTRSSATVGMISYRQTTPGPYEART